MIAIDWEHDTRQQRIAKRQGLPWAAFAEMAQNERYISEISRLAGESEEAIVKLWRSIGWTLSAIKRYVLSLGMLPRVPPP